MSELHSGKLVINISDNALKVQSQVPLGEIFTEALVISAITLPELGMAIAPVDTMYGASSNRSRVLNPYSREITRIPLLQDFHVLGEEVVRDVPWIKRLKALKMTREPEAIGTGAMRHWVQTDNVNAIAFAQPVIFFNFDMSKLVMRVSVTVYAKGEHGPVFLDGGTLTASSSLRKSGEPLTSDEMDDVDEGRGFMNKVRAYRAKLWFASQGERFNIALAEDLRLIKPRLVSYLRGRRHA